MSAQKDRLVAATCGASMLATTGGPTAVPFRLCCAHSILQTGGGGSTVVRCVALDAGAVETRPVPGPPGAAP